MSPDASNSPTSHSANYGQCGSDVHTSVYSCVYDCMRRSLSRCHGLRVYPVCVCNTVRLGQVRSRHNLKPSGTRFARVSGLRV